MWNNLSNRWQEYFIKQLHLTASMSKDENTQVGALIIDTYDKVAVSSGWNDLPRGVKHTKERNSRPLKYQFTSHAEMSCLTNALRIGVNVKMKTMLVTLGCCPICMQSIINSGVYELVTPNLDFEHVSCGEHYQYSLDMAKESGIIWSFDDRLKLGGV